MKYIIAVSFLIMAWLVCSSMSAPQQTLNGNGVSSQRAEFKVNTNPYTPTIDTSLQWAQE